MKDFFDTMNNAMNTLSNLKNKPRPTTITYEVDGIDLEVVFNADLDVIQIFIEETDVTELLQFHATLWEELPQLELERQTTFLED